MRLSLRRLREGLRFLRRETARNGLRFPSMIAVPGFRRTNVRRYFKNFIRSPRAEHRNPKEPVSVSRSPKRLWNCTAARFGLNPKRVAAALFLLRCRYSIRNAYPYPLPERAREKWLARGFRVKF